MSPFFIRFYEAMIRIGESFQPYFLLFIRLYWGFLFLKSGLHKFQDIPETIQFFQNLHIPFAEINAYLVAFFEFLGGILLILGLGSRLICIPLIVIMIIAYLTAHREALLNVFHDMDTFTSQSPFNFILACLIIFSFGAGKFSIDYLLKKRTNLNGAKK